MIIMSLRLEYDYLKKKINLSYMQEVSVRPHICEGGTFSSLATVGAKPFGR